MTPLPTILVLLLSSLAAFGQTAPRGFKWKHFSEVGVTVQVPDGWHTRILKEKGTKALQVTKEKPTAKGFETGLTINLIRPKSDAEMAAKIIGMGHYMANLHDSFSKIVESRVTEKKGVPTWILEGSELSPVRRAGASTTLEQSSISSSLHGASTP